MTSTTVTVSPVVCYAVTSRGKECGRPAVARIAGNLPVCGIHERAEAARGGEVRPLEAAADAAPVAEVAAPVVEAEPTTSEPEAPVDPLPVVEPVAPAAEPDTTTLPEPDAAPIKARTGHRVLDWIAGYPEAWPELAVNAATARRYKDRCAVLELTGVEAAQLRVAASQMVEQGQHVVPAKGVLRWLDAAGVSV